MTLVDATTGEGVEDCTPERARQLTDQIKTAVEATWHLIVEAYQSGVHRALGYSSWDDYCTREFGTSRIKLPREERQEVVASLRDSGLSIRAIAAATGASPMTVQNDLRPGVPVEHTSAAPEVEDAEVVEDPDPRDAYDRASDALDSANRPTPEPAPVVGIDGKTYPAKPTTPAKPKRQPLTDQAAAAGRAFRTATERIERIADDDRLGANKEQVAAVLRGHLTFAIEVCQDLLDGLDTNQQES